MKRKTNLWLAQMFVKSAQVSEVRNPTNQAVLHILGWLGGQKIGLNGKIEGIFHFSLQNFNHQYQKLVIEDD